MKKLIKYLKSTSNIKLINIAEQIWDEQRKLSYCLADIRCLFLKIIESNNQWPCELPKPNYIYKNLTLARDQHLEKEINRAESSEFLRDMQILHDKLEKEILQYFIHLRIQMDEILKLLNESSKYLHDNKVTISQTFRDFVKSYFNGSLKNNYPDLWFIIGRCINPWILLKGIRNELKSNSHLNINYSNGDLLVSRQFDTQVNFKMCELVKDMNKFTFDFTPDRLNEFINCQEDICLQIESFLISKI